MEQFWKYQCIIIPCSESQPSPKELRMMHVLNILVFSNIPFCFLQITSLTEGPYSAKVSLKLVFPGSHDDFFTMDTAFSGKVFSSIAGFSSVTFITYNARACQPRASPSCFYYCPAWLSCLNPTK